MISSRRRHGARRRSEREAPVRLGTDGRPGVAGAHPRPRGPAGGGSQPEPPPQKVETVERGSLATDHELEICVLRKENADLKLSLEKAQQTLAKAQKVLKQAPDAAAAAARDEELERLRDELAQAKRAAERPAATPPRRRRDDRRHHTSR